MRPAIAAAVASLALVFVADGQQVAIGVVGGTNLTANFPITDYSGAADEFGNPAYHFQFKTGSRSFILGASIEGRISERFSIEANVLHRPMKRTILFTTFSPDGSSTSSVESATAVRAWEFPLLFKYTLPASRLTGRWRPFVAVGPSFRTQEDANATEPSRLGFSAGVGVAVPFGRFRFSPTLRYTRWAREDIYPRYATKPDQLEFLASFAYETHADSRRVAGRRLEIGALLGVGLTGGFDDRDGTIHEQKRVLAGLSAQIPTKGNWSLEVDAIYKPFRANERLGPNYDYSFSVLTWQFPVLAKYHWNADQAEPPGGWTPFVAAGPSFRLAGNLNGYNPSHFGATLGAGLEKQTQGYRFSPAVRYTRWITDSGTYSRMNPNVVEILFGVSF